MLRIKRLIVASIVAASVAVVVAAPTPASAMSPCQGRSLPLWTEYSGNVAVAGAYTTAGATDVWLTCGIVQNGVTVARFSEDLSGPVAAVEGTATVSGGGVGFCYELAVTYVNRPPTSSDTCP